MTDLEKLTQFADEDTARAARIGYALGFTHGRAEDRSPDLDIYGPEFRALDEMRGTWL